MYIKVKVTAGAKTEDLQQITNDTFKVKVREKAERNMANRRVCEIVASYFNVPVGKVKIVSGHHSPSKILSIVSVV